jgi:hypothetical protein
LKVGKAGVSGKIPPVPRNRTGSPESVNFIEEFEYWLTATIEEFNCWLIATGVEFVESLNF